MNTPVETRTTCPYCGVGCGIIATVDAAGDVTIRGDEEHPANYGRLCSKGSALGETLGLDDRLLYPEINGGRVQWDEALDRTAAAIRAAIERHGSDAVAFYVSGQLLTEDYYVANKLMKGFIGCANIDSNSRLCMSSAVAGYRRALGADTVPCDYADLEQAELVLLIGSNTAWCHPVVFQRIAAARRANPAMRVVVIDPRKTPTCDIADLYLPVNPGTDVILFNGLLHYLWQQDAIDQDFIDGHTRGWSAAIRVAQDSAPSLAVVAQSCGVSETVLAELYRMFASTPLVISLFSQGVNQSCAGTDKVNAIINCHLASGRIGKPGCGPFSITGQPNAMGGRETGALANQLAAHMDLENPRHRDLVRRFWKAPVMAERPGRMALDLFRAVHKGDIKVLWIMATNPVVSLPDADYVRDALKCCDTVIVSDCTRRTDTNNLAHILLPALTWGEKDGSVTNSERRISRQRPFLPAPGEAKPDWWIICEVAKRLGFNQGFNFQSAAQIFREHALLSGYENHGERDFDISPLAHAGDGDYHAMQPQQWPLGKDANGGGVRPFSGGRFYFADGKARFAALDFVAPCNGVTEDYPYILNSGRVRDHWHTLTRTGKSPRLSRHRNEPYAEIHPSDAARLNIRDGQLVRVQSRWGSTVARSAISTLQKENCIFMPLHWNGEFSSAGHVNSVVNPVADPLSGQPESKHTPVRIRPMATAWEGFLLTRSDSCIPWSGYWSRDRCDEHWHYHIAGSEVPGDWSAWARELLSATGVDGNWLEYLDTGTGQYRAARLAGGRLESCLFVAPERRLLPDIAWLQGLFNNDRLEKSERTHLLAGRCADSAGDQGAVVCSCFVVRQNTIINSIIQNNIIDVKEVGRLLGAGTNCGSCIPELRELLQNTTLNN